MKNKIIKNNKDDMIIISMRFNSKKDKLIKTLAASMGMDRQTLIHTAIDYYMKNNSEAKEKVNKIKDII